ncbi:MAG: hypothetical protein Fur0035_12180 [Anaerolineales bacterium]
MGKEGVFDSQALLQFLEKYQRALMISAGIFIIGIHTLEIITRELTKTSFGPVFYLENLAVIALLICIEQLFSLLLKALKEKSQLTQILTIKNQVYNALADCHTIPELSSALTTQIAGLVPAAIVKLYIHEEGQTWFTQAHSKQNKVVIDKSEVSESLDLFRCENCMTGESSPLRRLQTCAKSALAQGESGRSGFCLALYQGKSAVGLALLYLPENDRLTDFQTLIFDNLHDEISRSIGSMITQKTREEARLKEKIRTMQLDIARDLHDTVGQNIGYLRMKLDYLAEKGDAPQSEMAAEIESMSKVANESYDLVRGTLNILQSDDSADLPYLFSRYAKQVAYRSRLKVDFLLHGAPRSLSPSQMRHLFYIYREALSNVEKHANAKNVTIDIKWTDEQFVLAVSDDGEGYDLNRTQRIDVHYGLKFMRERAELLHGTLSIESRVGLGTSVIFQMPT